MTNILLEVYQSVIIKNYSYNDIGDYKTALR